MKRKFARAIRKFADLIDPAVEPSDTITIRLEIDPSAAQETLDHLEAIVKRVNEAKGIA